MKRISILIILVVLVSGCFTSLKASPAFPGLISFSQPDGSKVNIYLRGDEKVHWAESEDGYSLVYDDNGYLCYAIKNANGDMIASEFRASDITARPQAVKTMLMSTQKELRFSHQQVSDYLAVWDRIAAQAKHNSNSKSLTGSRRALVILFQTPDCQLHHRKSEFLALFNEHNYTAGNAHGSVYDYYHEASNGQFNLQVDVLGPITADHDMAYYGSDNSQGSWEFGTEVAQKIAGMADFSEYDNDGDGVVDGMHIIFAGYGEEAGGGSDRIWSHQWYVWNAPTYDGITFGPYSCSPELRGNFGTNLTRIGVICHELGHVFGAPDYYDTDYEGSGGQFNGLGKWDIMSSGSWNDNGRTPARHGAYTTSYIYNWTSPIELSEPQSVRMPQTRDGLVVYRINTSSNGDFFLLENRQKCGFDRYIPGHGMIVYHAHPNANGSSVSNATHPQQLYILSASSTYQQPGNTPNSYGATDGGGTPFPGTSHKDSLTDNSTPWLRPWSGAANNTPIFDIQESVSDSSIFFNFISPTNIEPNYIEAHYTSEYTAAVQWNAIGTHHMLVLVSDSPNNFYTPDSTYHIGDTLTNGNIVVYSGNSLNHSIFTLDSSQTPTNLFFKVFCKINDSTYTEGPYSMAVPYEFFHPQPISIDAKYTAERNVNVQWSTSEPCRMLVLMSNDNQFDTPFGTYNEGDITENSDVVFFYGEGLLSKTYIVPDSHPIDTIFFKVFCRTYYDDYSDGIEDFAIPYEYYRPRPKTISAEYTSYRNIDISWTVSEECESLLLMSTDRHFDTPYGSYNIGDLTQSGDIVIYRGTDTLNVRYTIPSNETPDTMYFKVFCRYHGDSYSTGKFTQAIPIEQDPDLSITPCNNKNLFSIRPNPARDKVTIEATQIEDAEVVVTDQLGRRISSQKMKGGSTTIDTSRLPRGTYFISVTTQSQRSVSKLILQ